MLTVKQGTTNKIAIGIADGTGAGVTGLPYTAVSISLAKAGVAAAAKVLAPGDWVEAGQGWYWVTLSAADTDTLGPAVLLTTYASASGAYDFEVVANLEADTVALLGAPAGVSLAADVAAVKGDTSAVKAKTDNLPANPASQTNLDVAVSTRLATAGYTAPDNATIASALAAATNALHAALGLFLVVRAPTYAIGTPDLTQVTVRLYDSQTNANADDGVTGLVLEFTRAITYGATALAGDAHQIAKVVGS